MCPRQPRNSRIRNDLLVALVSFGKLSTNNIASILYRLNVPYKIVLPHETPNFIPTHIILSGGTNNVCKSNYLSLPEWIINCECPVLGICYGMQLIAHTFGGIITKMLTKEKCAVEITEISETLQQTTKSRWMNRRNFMMNVPEQFDIIAVTKENHVAAFTDRKKWWGVQYHPESRKYEDLSLFKRFLYRTKYEGS